MSLKRSTGGAALDFCDSHGKLSWMKFLSPQCRINRAMENYRSRWIALFSIALMPQVGDAVAYTRPKTVHFFMNIPILQAESKVSAFFKWYEDLPWRESGVRRGGPTGGPPLSTLLIHLQQPPFQFPWVQGKSYRWTPYQWMPSKLREYTGRNEARERSGVFLVTVLSVTFYSILSPWDD